MSSSCIQWTHVTNWGEIYPHLHSPSPVFFLVSASTLQRLGVPILKAYSDFLSPYEHCCLTIECNTAGQALSCFYHGIKRILYTHEKERGDLESIARKMNVDLIFYV